MNKRYWLSLALDDTLSDEMVLKLIERSWNPTVKKNRGIRLSFQTFN